MRRAGTRRTKVTFHRLEAVADAYGNQTTGFADTPFLSEWAEIIERTVSRESAADGAPEAAQISFAYVPWSSDANAVTTADQIRAGARLFNIRSIVNVGERNRTLRMAIERGAAQ